VAIVVFASIVPAGFREYPVETNSHVDAGTRMVVPVKYAGFGPLKKP